MDETDGRRLGFQILARFHSETISGEPTRIETGTDGVFFLLEAPVAISALAS
jgi:hypothetical protein